MRAITGIVKSQVQKGKPSSPREMLLEPGRFGKSLAAYTTGEYWSLGAQAQSRVCWRVRTFMKEHGIDLLSLAVLTNHPYQRLSRVLNGSVWMNMEDLARLQAGLPEAFGLKPERSSRYPSPEELRRRLEVMQGYLRPMWVIPGAEIFPYLEWPPETP